jgi:soluble lytic murein transglycosylase-like protein
MYTLPDNLNSGNQLSDLGQLAYGRVPRLVAAANPAPPQTPTSDLSSSATGSHLKASKSKLRKAISTHYSKAQLNDLFDKASKKYHVPADLLKAVAYHESGWDPRAKSYDGHHGKGIMQIDDRSHKFAKTQAVWNPEKNINYGARLLADLHIEAGGGNDWRETIRRYNGTGKAADDYADLITGLMQEKPWQSWIPSDSRGGVPA